MKEETIRLTFPSLFNETVKKHGDAKAYAFAGEDAICYSEAAARISDLSAFLRSAGISHGDRVAILSTNMPGWPLSFIPQVPQAGQRG